MEQTAQLTRLSHNPLIAGPVRNTPEEQVFKVVTSAIAEAFIDLNVKSETVLFEGAEISFSEYTSNQVTDAILNRFKNIRPGEIRTAIYNGVRKKYGDFYGLNAVSIEGFIQAYIESDERKRLFADKEKYHDQSRQLSAKTEPTEEEKKSFGNANVKFCWTRFLQDEKVDDVQYHAAYKHLESLGKLNFSNDEKNLAWKEAPESLRMKEANRLFWEGKAGRIDVSLDELTRLSNYKDKRIREAKIILLRDWFKKLMAAGKEPEL